MRRDSTREIQNSENRGTSLHGPSPAGALAGLRRRHLCRHSPSRAIQRRPRTRPPSLGNCSVKATCLPSPKAWALLVLLELGQESGQREDTWVPVEWWGARNRKGRWGSEGSRAAARGTRVGARRASGKVCGGVRAGKAGRMPEEARVAGTRRAVIKASPLHPRHPPGLLRPSEAEAPRCGSRGWSARRSQSRGCTPKRRERERRLARPLSGPNPAKRGPRPQPWRGADGAPLCILILPASACGLGQHPEGPSSHSGDREGRGVGGRPRVTMSP